MEAFCFDELLGSIQRCIACITFLYAGSLHQIKIGCTHFLQKRSGMQITRLMLLGGWIETGRLFPPHDSLFVHQLVSCIDLLLFSVLRAAILRLKDILLVLVVWDLEKNITPSYTIVQRKWSWGLCSDNLEFTLQLRKMLARRPLLMKAVWSPDIWWHLQIRSVGPHSTSGRKVGENGAASYCWCKSIPQCS